jgi:hypothetical protein
MSLLKYVIFQHLCFLLFFLSTYGRMRDQSHIEFKSKVRALKVTNIGHDAIKTVLNLPFIFTARAVFLC